jgi:hypothetical protein
MKSCFNVFRGLVAFLLTVLYWLFLTVSFIALPLSLILKNETTVNNTLDDIRIEEQLVGIISQVMEDSQTQSGEDNTLPEVDYSELFNDTDLQQDIITTRRELVTSTYAAIDNKTSLQYEIDTSLVEKIYEGIFIQYFESLPVCDQWEDPAAIDESGDLACLPAPLALANGIEIPSTVDVPSDFEITDDLLFENMLEYEDSEDTQEMEPIMIEMDKDTTASLYYIKMILQSYVAIFIGVSIFSLLFIILVAPGIKVITILIGVLNIICSLVATVLWKLPDILLSQNSTYMSDGEEFSTEEYNELIKSVLNSISSKALIMALCVGIIGVILVIVGIILPKNKKDESEKQSTGKDNSTK